MKKRRATSNSLSLYIREAMKKRRATMKKLKTLPIEIFYHHIFVNLPVKSLSRFKAVCRQWNDLINEPNFVKMHLAKQRNNSQKLMIYSYPLRIYFSIDHQTISGDYDDDDIQAVKLQYPINDYRIPIHNRTTIAGSVNGLVCIVSSFIHWDEPSTMLVWNPTTGVHKILPPHPHVPVTQTHGIGFGYNSTADDYNVVRILLQGKESRIDIYSLKSNSWKLFMSGEGIPGYSSRILSRFRVWYVDGSIYWLACHMPPDDGILNNQFVACFDLKEVNDDDEKKRKKNLIREIPMPLHFGMVYMFSDLKVMGGCLSVFKVSMSSFKSLEMWSLMKINENKNDEVEYRWINKVMISKPCFLVHAICNGRKNAPLDCIIGVPICLSKDGNIVLRIFDNTPNEFVLYDTDTESIENLNPIHWISQKGKCFWDKVPMAESQMYIESLVSPNFMS